MARSTKAIIAVAVALFAAWLYFSPHLAVKSMKSAAESNDAEALSSQVDFPALKESLKASFSAQMLSKATNASDDNPFGAAGAALAMAMVGPMIDSLVTPQAVAVMMKGQKPQADSRSGAASSNNVETSMGYRDFSTFAVSLKDKGSAEEPLELIFKRHGLFSWKLSGVNLPM